MAFVITCIDKPGHEHVRKAARDDHLAYLRGMIDKVILAGPLLSDDGRAMIGSMLVMDFATETEVEDFLAGDPYAKVGLFESTQVRPYKPVLP